MTLFPLCLLFPLFSLSRLLCLPFPSLTPSSSCSASFYLFSLALYTVMMLISTRLFSFYSLYLLLLLCIGYINPHLSTFDNAFDVVILLPISHVRRYCLVILHLFNERTNERTKRKKNKKVSDGYNNFSIYVQHILNTLTLQPTSAKKQQQQQMKTNCNDLTVMLFFGILAATSFLSIRYNTPIVVGTAFFFKWLLGTCYL